MAKLKDTTIDGDLVVTGNIAGIEVFKGNNNGLVPKPANKSATNFLSANGTWEPIDVSTAVTNDDTNPVSSDAVYTALETKVPTAGENQGDTYFLNAENQWAEVKTDVVKIGADYYSLNFENGVLEFTSIK